MSFSPFGSFFSNVMENVVKPEVTIKQIVKRIQKSIRWSRRYPVKGDHIRVRRLWGYYHHGIYVSDNEVIHYNTTGAGDGLLGDAKVLRTDLYDFLEGAVCEVRNYSFLEKGSLFSPGIIVKRARSELGKGGYNLVFNNCEHFANWCMIGMKRSEQVEDIFDVINDRVLR
ncbi:MAG: lecithin retinol acyltransferase family protein [Spirochaetia bacterium]|nr:lecithin retinol acyltransferase family protein [Spirochaetia bacterium]